MTSHYRFGITPQTAKANGLPQRLLENIARKIMSEAIELRRESGCDIRPIDGANLGDASIETRGLISACARPRSVLYFPNGPSVLTFGQVLIASAAPKQGMSLIRPRFFLDNVKMPRALPWVSRDAE